MRRDKNPALIRSLLRCSHVAQGEIAMTACLGMPYYVLESGELRVRYLLHREKFLDGNILIYAPHQMVEVKCDSGRVSLLMEIDYGAAYAPIYRCNADSYYQKQAMFRPELEAQEEKLVSLYNEGLPRFMDGRAVSMTHPLAKELKSLVRKYQNSFRRVVSFMGLERLYGGLYNE